MNWDNLLEATSIEDAQIQYEYEEGGQFNNPSVEQIEEQFFKAAMKQMENYIRKSELGSVNMLQEDNVEQVFITNKPYEATTVVVEFHQTPEGFKMPNAVLCEFTWRPRPGKAREFTAAYFQFREAK